MILNKFPRDDAIDDILQTSDSQTYLSHCANQLFLTMTK